MGKQFPTRNQMAKKSKYEKAILLESPRERETFQDYPVVSVLSGADLVVFIDTKANIDYALLEQGFRWLDRWEVIAPFRPYAELAQDIAGSEVLKIGDLRQPVYDPRLIFIKTNAKGKKFWERFTSGKEVMDPRLAFLSALWDVKPLTKPLPAGRWIKYGKTKT